MITQTEYLTDQELMDELSKRYTSFIFCGDILSKESVEKSIKLNPVWYKGSWSNILGCIEFSKIAVLQDIEHEREY